MKKFLIGMVAVMCCLAFSAPAFAEVKVEGMITADAYYIKKNSERAAGGVFDGVANDQDSWDSTRFSMAQPLNRVTVRYTGEDKKVNGYIQLRAGGIRNNPAGDLPGTSIRESNFSWEYAWIDWHINPSLYLRLGRQDQIFANAYAPAQLLGWSDGHIIGLGFGNMTGQSRDGVRAFIKFSDMVRMEVAVYDPNTEAFLAAAASEFALPAEAGAGIVTFESNILPRLDISLPIKIANFSIEPGFTYLQQKWQQVASGVEDSLDVWGATLGASAAFGPLSFMGEITYGENLGNGNYIPAAGAGAPVGNAAALVVRPNGDLDFEDGESLMWFIQGAFNFGPGSVQLIYGQYKAENDNTNASGDTSEATQKMYGIVVPFYVTKTFTVAPSLFYYDLDDNAKIAGADIDRGSEIVGGVQFQLVF